MHYIKTAKQKKMEVTYQDDADYKNQSLFNSITCCIADQVAILGLLHENEYTNSTNAAKQNKIGINLKPRPRSRLSSRMPFNLRQSSKDLLASFTETLTESNAVINGDDYKNPHHHHHHHLPRYNNSIDSDGCVSTTQLLVPDEYGRTGSFPTLRSLLDGEEERDSRESNNDDEAQDDEEKDNNIDTPSESRDTPPSPSEDEDVNNNTPTLELEADRRAHRHRTPSEDVLALEVGNNAFEYLEECFYTEVSVLDREKFNAIPEFVKMDFTIKAHLGKGSFSDVFEVVRTGGQPFDAEFKMSHPISSDKLAESPHAAAARRRPSRGRRTSLSNSINITTLSRPSLCDRHRSLGVDTDPRFAMKCLRPQIRSDVDQFTIGAEDLVHETAILSTLDHPHIIKLHGRASGNLSDAFVLNDGYFILLDRLNETLHERIDAWQLNPKCSSLLGGPTVKQIEVAHSVANAMSYLHSKNIVFRDLKPANVGFDSMGVLKLFDFGFAIGLPEKDEVNPAGFLYDTCGTPRYMAPEVGLSLGYGLKSDVYSFGILLWECCALAKPFASITSSSEFQRDVVMGGKRPVMDHRWPLALKDLMRRCWSANPGARPKCWMDVKSSLSLVMTDISNESKSHTRTVRSSLVRSRMTRGKSNDPW